MPSDLVIGIVGGAVVLLGLAIHAWPHLAKLKNLLPKPQPAEQHSDRRADIPNAMDQKIKMLRDECVLLANVDSMVEWVKACDELRDLRRKHFPTAEEKPVTQVAAPPA